MNGLEQLRGVAGLAVSDMDRAVEFYEGKLGLSRWTGLEDNRACAEGSVLHVYLSPEHAGGSTATLARPYVGGIELVVDELTANGVVFERYDQAPIFTDDKGIAAFDGGAKVAYFKDPDGNTLSIAQAGCS